MYLYQSMQSQLETCEKQIAGLEKKMAGLPEGVLHITRNGKYYNWFVSYADGRRCYLPKSEEDLAAALALKRYCTAKLHDLQNEAEACRRYLRYDDRSRNEAADLICNPSPEFRRLLCRTLRTTDERIADWENAPYKKLEKYPEQRIHETLKEGELVRSKIEAAVAGLLYTLKIPYRYECMMQIDTMEIGVDFITLDVRSFQEIPLEIYGMMDNPEYRRSYQRKMNAYTNAGYIPGINMLMFFESSSAPLKLTEAEAILRRFFFENPPVRMF